MPASQSPRTRARDIDRSALCSVLDTAYADGQLDPAEHGTRTAAAMQATTVGELRALVDDLQLDTPLPELRAPARSGGTPRRARWVGAIVSIVLLAAGFGIGRLTAGDPVPSGTSATADGEVVAPVVVGSVALHSPSGWKAFTDALRARFGTTAVADATVYPDYAVVTMPVPGAPNRELSYYYKGGFDAPQSPSTRDASLPLIDLAAIDAEKVLGLVAGAGQSLSVENPTSRYMIVRDTGNGPTISVYASNEFHESGYLDARPDGTIITINPYEPTG